MLDRLGLLWALCNRAAGVLDDGMIAVGVACVLAETHGGRNVFVDYRPGIEEEERGNQRSSRGSVQERAEELVQLGAFHQLLFTINLKRRD